MGKRAAADETSTADHRRKLAYRTAAVEMCARLLYIPTRDLDSADNVIISCRSRRHLGPTPLDLLQLQLCSWLDSTVSVQRTDSIVRYAAVSMPSRVGLVCRIASRHSFSALQGHRYPPCLLQRFANANEHDAHKITGKKIAGPKL